MSVKLTNFNAELLARKGTTPHRETRDGISEKLWADRSGALVTLAQYQALVNEGKVWCFNAGVAATSVEAGGAYDADTEDMSLDVPVGITVLPLSIEVTIDVITDNEDIDMQALASRTLTAVSGGTAGTPVNMRLDLDHKTRCTAYSSVTGNASTDPNTAGASFEFWRQRLELGAAPVAAQSEEGRLLTFKWTAVGQGFAPVLVGAASLSLYIPKGTAAKFYGTIIYAELESTSIV